MSMTILRCLKGLCGAAALAGAMAVIQVPAEAQRGNAVHRAASTTADAAAQRKTLQQIKSVPPRKRSRCND